MACGHHRRRSRFHYISGRLVHGLQHTIFRLAQATSDAINLNDSCTTDNRFISIRT